MKRILLIALLVAVGVGLSAQDVRISWKTDPVNGRFTGVTASNASNVEEAMGYVKGCSYYSPGGKVFRRGSTRKVAKLMLEAQPAMAMVKEVIGYSTEAMIREYGECKIYDWFIDEVMRATADSTGKRVDIGFANRGGVRVDMPQGEILYDDIMSMFPFKNSLCYVALYGRDVRVILDQMAASSFEIVGGVKVTVRNGKVVSATVNGEPLDDDRIYGVATISFLLDGGDGYRIGNNAVEIVKCNGWIFDTMIPYVRQLTAAGKAIEFEDRHWITILGEGDAE